MIKNKSKGIMVSELVNHVTAVIDKDRKHELQCTQASQNKIIHQ
jgi:hypothetical protein